MPPLNNYRTHATDIMLLRVIVFRVLASVTWTATPTTTPRYPFRTVTNSNITMNVGERTREN